MLRSGMVSTSAVAATRGATTGRAALPPVRAALPNTIVVVATAAVGDSRSISSAPRGLAASTCASTSGSSQRVATWTASNPGGLGAVHRRRRIARSRRSIVTSASASAKDENDSGDEQQQPSTSSSSSSDAAPQDLATLRAKLERAIEAEDYALAASLRDALRALEDDAVAGVTEANARFYAAFRAADIDVMASCLGFGDHVTVIHPGCNAITGRDAVLESWRVIFSGATRAAGRGAAVALDIEAVEMQVYAPPVPKSDPDSFSSASSSSSGSPSSSSSSLKSNSNSGEGTGALGVVTCVERVDSGDSTGRVVATNVFERGSDGRYRMILHHGSSAPPLRRKA